MQHGIDEGTPADGTRVRVGQGLLSHDRYCAEIVAQTGLLRDGVAGADLAAPVPSCPGWNLAQLLRHVGEGHRWAETIVRTRAAEPLSDEKLRDLSGDPEWSPAAVDAWLAEGAARLAATLRAAGPDAEVWTPLPGEKAAFLARRFTHETAVHRADAFLAAGADFVLDSDVAGDALDEWMRLESLPQVFDYQPAKRDLLGPGRTLHFHATDAGAGVGEWLVDLTGDVIACRRAHEAAAVTARGPLNALLLLVYGRLPARRDGIEITGDARLLDWWLERVGFGV
ncbi:maleylpyruvate isomerase family mycothiol-dependent enzyme [Sphaerisporangium album]|uniref:Maleylpyruvate isomerase family mycothiol-dependent enzyme n=1 Tax=Sphaerisporangium album TaxID=509200 RepID=A0A367FA17_9ACTN|nr:maleylpyruvate isomerase family mycothiol-dependent enzyme [Sphaerisporangium album]RCG26525.1 maleylpyruvate isomerase family mycothiol-dependent enzyme [Sphaerisporangium album]